MTNSGALTGATVQNGVTVTTTTGTAVSLNNAGGAFTFQSVSANGGSRGIYLTSTTGSFTVTGNAGNCTTLDPTCSGGTLQNMTGGDDSSASPAGAAVVLNGAQNVSLTRVRIRGNSNYGIRGTSVVGFTLDNSLMDGTTRHERRDAVQRRVHFLRQPHGKRHGLEQQHTRAASTTTSDS